MTPKRWQQVKEVFQSALEVEGSRRAAFLDEACAGDPALRSQVEALIASHEGAPGFLEAPAFEVLPTLEEDEAGLMIGQRIGPYEVLRRIGHGGMGEVYGALDTNLKREVAIKALPKALARNPERMARFRREAQLLASLNHPNIAAIYGFEESEGAHYLVLELVPGQTLAERLVASRLSVEEALRICGQIAEALEAAHEKGIIHRDIKSSNLMLTALGQVKVLDFGLAKVLQRPAANKAAEESTLTQPEETASGIVMGTVRYMSPEQARGLPVDARTDLFSLGVVLYEMVAGRVPFDGETSSDVLVSILEHEPERLARHRPEVPAELERIVRRCLEKDRERRYPSAGELVIDLKRLQRNIDSGGRTVVKGTARATRLRLTFAAVALAVLTLIGVETYRLRGRSQAIDSLAVLPFRNESADPNMEYLSDGITESLINSLSQLPNLRVMARSTVFRYKGKDIDLQKVGLDLHVQAAVAGRIQRRGDLLIVAAEMVDVEKGSQLWGGQYNRKVADIIAIQEEISKEISDKLQLRLTGEEQKRLTKRYTENPEAYQAYLKGRYFWKRGTEEALRKGIEYFQQALEQDPSYALAYAGLADSYALLGINQALPPKAKEAFPKAKAAALQALKLDGTLAEPHASLAVIRFLFDWDWLGAESEFKRAIELNPAYPAAHHWYGYYLLAMGRLEQALLAMQTAQELDPLSLTINTAIGQVFCAAHQYDRAIEQLRKTLELDSNFALAHAVLGDSFGQKAEFEEAIAEYQKAVALSGGTSDYSARLGNIYAVSGKKEAALKILGELRELSQRRHVSPSNFVLVYIGLGDKDQAFAWLEKAYEERSADMAFLKIEPVFDSLRSDPRFQDLLRRMKFPLE